jgi:hypothetical protein
MPWGSKIAVPLALPYILVHHLPFSPYLLPYVWKKGEGQKKEKPRKKGNMKKYQDLISKVLPSLPP